jgi:glycosyltransferase involved in cell wall biosynthesis
MSGSHLRFSFGMIVFNGETFLNEVLKSVYDFAYEIIIVEGPDRNALPMAGPDGGSNDRTIEILRTFPDPERKLKVIRGQWKDKDEQSNRYLTEARGDYIWEIDDDEVYKPEDLEKIEKMLINDPETTAVSFYWQNFFKSFKRVMVAEPPYEVWRLFRLRPGYIFKSHRPPTVIDPVTGASMNEIKPIKAERLAAEDIYIYHYSYIFDNQVRDKIRYHENYWLREAGVGIPSLPRFLNWAQNGWQKFWMTSAMSFIRKKKDRSFHYDYFEKIWKAWDKDPEGIECRYGISPSPGPYRRTSPFLGHHPLVIQKRFEEARE